MTSQLMALDEEVIARFNHKPREMVAPIEWIWTCSSLLLMGPDKGVTVIGHEREKRSTDECHVSKVMPPKHFVEDSKRGLEARTRQQLSIYSKWNPQLYCRLSLIIFYPTISCTTPNIDILRGFSTFEGHNNSRESWTTLNNVSMVCFILF